ncbi:hypothetical protein JD844_031941 [Phrynosoma platyrhinos]|uniref:Uncharacterized protein n=1 Tax=Phrynosoma platyrhinos TaxID=52577 RepID=A0ABQ7T4G6_PHRPL|nr:hypothetical protein JD844_031941 [Phrynosoma platyrhinos]
MPAVRPTIPRRTYSESESSAPSSLPSSISAPSFLKSFYQSSGKPPPQCENELPKRHVIYFGQVTGYFLFFPGLSYSDGERRKRTSSVCSNESLNAGGIPLTPRRISWRQRIFLRVASPMKKSPSAMQLQGLYAFGDRDRYNAI